MFQEGKTDGIGRFRSVEFGWARIEARRKGWTAVKGAEDPEALDGRRAGEAREGDRRQETKARLGLLNAESV